MAKNFSDTQNVDLLFLVSEAKQVAKTHVITPQTLFRVVVDAYHVIYYLKSSSNKEQAINLALKEIINELFTNDVITRDLLISMLPEAIKLATDIESGHFTIPSKCKCNLL
ncbi:MAG: hypothetical protein ACYCPT_03885 [Acidimicrobiales bacterium]